MFYICECSCFTQYVQPLTRHILTPGNHCTLHCILLYLAGTRHFIIHMFSNSLLCLCLCFFYISVVISSVVSRHRTFLLYCYQVDRKRVQGERSASVNTSKPLLWGWAKWFPSLWVWETLAERGNKPSSCYATGFIKNQHRFPTLCITGNYF